MSIPSTPSPASTTSAATPGPTPSTNTNAEEFDARIAAVKSLPYDQQQEELQQLQKDIQSQQSKETDPDKIAKLNEQLAQVLEMLGG